MSKRDLDLKTSIIRAMEGAGTIPAAKSVKLVPEHWHRVIELGRAASEELTSLRALLDQARGELIRRGTRLQKLEAALSAIIERSNNGDLGTSKVIDMRKIAQEALN